MRKHSEADRRLSDIIRECLPGRQGFTAIEAPESLASLARLFVLGFSPTSAFIEDKIEINDIPREFASRPARRVLREPT
jgi:hypothetical protein